MIARDEEQFEYNSKGQLVRAWEKGKYNIYYFYDPLDRLIARKDQIGNYLTQFFYGDITHKVILKHAHNLFSLHGKIYQNEKHYRIILQMIFNVLIP